MAHPEEPSFPAAPWMLHGEAVVVLRSVPNREARAFIPTDARIVSIWPGSTLAVLYLARYDDTPVGAYRELIISPAIIRRGGSIGAWISHIWVDSEPALAAGRAIWALPKEHAMFRWMPGRENLIEAVRAQMAIRAAFATPKTSLRLPFFGAALSEHHGRGTRFVVRGSARITPARATLALSKEFGLSALGLEGSPRTLVVTDMRVIIGAPNPP